MIRRVRGVTWDNVHDEGLRAELQQLFGDRGFIVFEDMEPTPQMQVELSKVFGPLKDHPTKSTPRTDPDLAEGVIDMHRPERWGYVQFSTAKPGQAEFRTDGDWPARDLLHRVYYAERAYFKANGKYHSKPEALGLMGLSAPLSGPIQIETTASGFEASLTRPGGRGSDSPRRYSITHDALFRAE